jgi:ubiquitin carboxyl-terminal hydrolase 7
VSFGWDALDAFTQHDVQELGRVLCDNLEEKMKGTPVEKEVPRLFRGKLKNFVKCINVNFSSERVEDFYDLSLNVRGCKNLKESLEKYVEREKLDGDNKYMAEGHGLQDAEKGCTFSSFPPVLHLHLKRFEYDPLRDANVKINDRFEFDEEIDLAPYMEELPGRPEIYQLHSVLVHCGDVHGGHYYAYIRPDCKERWFKFNDEIVSISSREEAVESNFGFEEDSDRTHSQALMIQRSRPVLRRSSNAYMLVYVKEQAVGDVLRPLVSLNRIEP